MASSKTEMTETNKVFSQDEDYYEDYEDWLAKTSLESAEDVISFPRYRALIKIKGFTWIEDNLLQTANEYLPIVTKEQVGILEKRIVKFLQERDPEGFEEIAMNYAEDGDEENARDEISEQFGEDFYDFRQETFSLIDFDYSNDQMIDIILEAVPDS